ncbi:MAG TPA: hypothetical protein PKY22_05585 [Accumulibacter sp.]|nr:hypothetical protein [Accumulibacter sp.]
MLGLAGFDGFSGFDGLSGRLPWFSWPGWPSVADAAAEARRIAKIAAIFFISISLVVCGFELLPLAFSASLLHLAVADVLGGIGEVGFVAPVFGVAAQAHAVAVRLVFAACTAELEVSGGGH